MKIAGAIICFDKYDYTLQAVRSLEKSVEADNVDWYVFQDGVTNPITGISYTEEKKLDAVKSIFDTSTLPIKHFERSARNGSIPQQKYKAHQVFEMGDYDTIFFFEDDLVVSKHYLRLLRIMAEQLPNHIGMANRETNAGRLNQLVQCTIARLWGYYMTRQVYDSIKEDYSKYYHIIKNIDYNNRRMFSRKDYDHESLPTGTRMHDITLTRICRNLKIRKYWPRITRATYIGKYGKLAYRTDAYWKKKGMNRQPKRIEYEEDATMKTWKII